MKKGRLTHKKLKEIHAYLHEASIIHDPMEFRYRTVEDALADQKEGTRKRSIIPIAGAMGSKPVLNPEYRDAPFAMKLMFMNVVYKQGKLKNWKRIKSRAK